ncbi:hypothetical protein FQA47_004000 [Oryzias melastigma]|uniref:Uncharacterized protein n=1 Tax=Oryzias melastigma TaxID=30732 RepID=A0A834C5F0_ORYME|nr:hypothetical protein FQA47_004000 [Oryzias melastigma]
MHIHTVVVRSSRVALGGTEVVGLRPAMHKHFLQKLHVYHHLPSCFNAESKPNKETHNRTSRHLLGKDPSVWGQRSRPGLAGAAERSDLGDVDVGRRETSRCEEPTDIAKLLLTRHDLTLCHRLAGVRFLSVFTPLMTNTDGDDSSELLQGLPSTFLPEPRVTHSRALEPAASSWFGFGASRPRLSAGGRQTQQLP